MSRSSHSIVKVWLVRLIASVLALSVIAAWGLVGLDLDARPSWLTIEAALGVTGGAIGVVILIIIVAKLTGSKSADLGPPRPR